MKTFMHDLGGGTFSVVSTSFDDVGSHNVEIVGVDDAGWLTIVPFMVIIKRNSSIYIDLTYVYSMLLHLHTLLGFGL